MATKAKGKAGSKSGAKKPTRCWPGYEPTPGKKPYAKRSCKKKGA